MKKLVVCLAVVAITLAIGFSASAQSAALVKIPFSFIAGQRLMPAGTYRIAPTAGDWGTVTITRIDAKESPAVIVQTVGESSEEPFHGEAHVRFMPYGGQQFLQEIGVPGRDLRRVVVNQASADRTLAKLNLLSGAAAEPAK